MSFTKVYRFQDLNGYESVISKANSEMTYMGFARILLKAGQTYEYEVVGQEHAIVLQQGDITVWVDYEGKLAIDGAKGSRRNVYDDLPTAVYAPPKSKVRLYSEPSGEASITIKNGNNVIGTNGLTKNYGDLVFALRAELKNLTGAVTWKVYAATDESGNKTDAESAAVLSISPAGQFTIKGAGTAWVTASVGETTSPAVKIIVARSAYSVNLTAAKSKTYGEADALNFSYGVTGKYDELFSNLFTRDSGEDAGTYQIWMYDFETLNVDKAPSADGFADAYKAACKTKFEQEHPNYTLNLTYTQGQTGNYAIHPKVLGSSGALNEKNYDGTTDGTINTTAPVTQILPADLGSGVSVAIDVHFDFPNVKRDESSAVVKEDGEVIVTLTGDKVKNYSVPADTATVTWETTGTGDGTKITMTRDGLSALIKPIALSYATGPKVKVYDGTTEAPFDFTILAGLAPVDQEKIASLSAKFADKNVGNDKVFTLASAGDAILLTNYTHPKTFAANITPAPLSVTGLTAASKVYDGTIAAVLSGTPVIDASGKIGQDDVSVAPQIGELTGEFYDKNVGHKKSVSVSTGLGLTGVDAHNYYLKPMDTMQADITPAGLTVVPDADQFKPLGSIDPKFIYALEGLQGDDAASVVRGTLFRAAGETVGEYAYTLGSLTANSNYTLALADGAHKFAIRNTDATLSALTVSGGTLTPAFNPEVETYTVKLPYGATAVPTVNATANDSGAKAVTTPAENQSDSSTVVVTAADGISTKTYTVSFSVAEAVSVTATTVKATTGQSDGMIIAAGVGGSGSYEYRLDHENWQISNIFSGKTAGSYTLYIRDAADTGNSASVIVEVELLPSEPVSVGAPTALTADPAAPIIPHSADSLAVTLEASGVNGASYVYFVDAAGATEATISGSTLTVTGAGTVTISAKAVKDGAISASAKTLTLTISKAAAVSATATVTNVTVYGGTNGSIQFTASGGLGTYQYRLNSGAWQSAASFTGLKAGTYQVSVRDAEDIANIVTQSLSVEQAPVTDAAAISAVLESLTLGDTTAVTASLTLPVSESYGEKAVSISWATSDSAVVAANGTVTRPANSVGDQTVTLTATLELSGITNTKTFLVTVLKNPLPSGGTDDRESSTTSNVHKELPFSDVENHWAKNAIAFVTGKGLFFGTTETTFSPEKTMSRAMLMTVLARLDGQDTATGGTWYSVGMEWAVAAGISDGTNPNGQITREQLAAMLYRYAGSPETTGTLDGFTDADKAGGYAVDAMRWAVQQRLINGKTGGLLSPRGNATRGEVATIIMRFAETSGAK